MHASRPPLTLAVAFAIVCTASCKIADLPPASDTTALKPLKVVDVAYMDTTVNACNDFFEFANGTWLKTDTIPAAYSSSGVFKDMADRNELVVKSVLEDAVAKAPSLPDSSTERKLGTFYASCMDSTAIEGAGLTPVAPTLASINAIAQPAALMPAIARLQMSGANVLFRYSPSVDAHDAAHYIADLDRGGLGLPDRDYYLNPAASADSTRRAYVAHIARMFVLAGEDSSAAATDAGRVMSLETDLAKAQLARVARRDPKATDHQMPVSGLERIAPHVQWASYFHDIGITAPLAKVNVDEPAFMREVSALVATRPLDDWRAYLRYHAISNAAPWLSSAFVNENFAFNRRFSGAKQLLPRWKRCLRTTDGEIGEALGQAYVAKTFPPDAKAKATQVINDIRAAFKQRLLKLTWMSDATRARALDKLARMGEKVGYPDHWRDYSKLQVATG
ncbi:MAG: M13 family peptidase, partial [Gemmatimonadaceae bacterium]